MQQTNTGSQQLAWVDLAKAVCIVLVVVMHCEPHFVKGAWADGTWLVDRWHMINETIRPIRMPLFFTVSGLLASSSIMKPREDTERKRMLRPLYLYVLWGVILQVLIPVLPEQSLFVWSEDNSLFAVLMVAVAAWYMVALAVYYVFTKLTMGLPIWAVLWLCVGLSLFATMFETSMVGHQHKILRCAVFFVLGVRLKPRIIDFANSATISRGLALLALYLPAALLCASLGTFFVVVDMIAVAMGITLAAVAAQRLSALVKPASWLGQRTLGVYLIHFLWLEAVLFAVQTWVDPKLLGSMWVGMTYPFMVAAVIIPASILTRSLLAKAGAWWLFDLPWGRENSAEERLQLIALR
jgi:uncharacterized membrane protein YcfT